MSLRAIPGRTAIIALAVISAAVLLALLMGMAVRAASWLAMAAVAALLLAAICDYASSLRAWRGASVKMTRHLPAAFAIGVKRPVHPTLVTERTTAGASRPYGPAP